MQKPNQKDESSWVAPLIRAVVTSPPTGPIDSLLCPVCDCDHQQYQGSGVLSPSKDGTKLTCAFPTADSMYHIDVPDDITVGGTTLYVRYHCLCGNHDWVNVTVFQQDHTLSWASELALPSIPATCKGKSAKSPQEQIVDAEEVKQPAKMGAAFVDPDDEDVIPAPEPKLPKPKLGLKPSSNPLADFLAKMGLASDQPMIVISPALVKDMNPEAYAQLQAQIGSALQQLSGAAQTVPVQQVPAEKNAKGKHPFVNLAPKMPLRYMSWGAPDDPSAAKIDDIGVLPTLPHSKIKTKNTPPHRCAGASNGKALDAATKWLFLLSVEMKAVLAQIHTMVYWDTTLIVVLDTGAEKNAVMNGVVDAIKSLDTLHPSSVHALNRKDYEALRKFKENKTK